MTEENPLETGQSSQLLGMAAEIVSAYASRNQMAQADLSSLIQNIHATLSGLADGKTPDETTEEESAAANAPLIPAVPIDASVTPDAIICLENGKPFKTLKRHLRTAYDMSPDEYRERWGLSKDYPMVAPNYSKRRAATAKKIGLGRKPKKK